MAVQVQQALAPLERERDRLLQVTIEQAERLGRLEAQLAQAQERIEVPEATTAAQDVDLDEIDQNAAEESSAPRRPWWAFWRA